MRSLEVGVRVIFGCTTKVGFEVMKVLVDFTLEDGRTCRAIRKRTADFMLAVDQV